MAQNKFALARYRVIDSMLHKNDYVKTSAIADKCIELIGFRVSQRTIQLDIEAMRYDPILGYNAPIGYCGRRKAYYYENRDYTLLPFSFVEQEAAILENLLKICPVCNQECCYDTLCKLVAKIKLYVN